MPKAPSPSESHKKQVMAYALKHSGVEASEKYGFNRSTISRWLREAGKARGKGKYSDDWWEEVRKYMGVLTDQEIADKFDCAKSTIGNKRRGYGIESKVRPKQAGHYLDQANVRKVHEFMDKMMGKWYRPAGCSELLEEINEARTL